MTQRNHSSRVTSRRSEHRAYWAGKCGSLPGHLHKLRSFFVRYYRAHSRPFPWRDAHVKPFHLLVAELLLVQTKAEDVARVWPKLTCEYPDPWCLGIAREPSLRRFLRPLGFQRQRAHALRHMSRALIDCFDGKVPERVEELLTLPHVGLYVANAVACFGYGSRVPIVDANVIRVFDRVSGIKGVRELRRRRDVWRLAWGALPRSSAASHNYGLLDFAAQICTSRMPRCEECDLASICCFGREKTKLQNNIAME